VSAATGRKGRLFIKGLGMAGIKPTTVTFYNGGQMTGVPLHDSHPESLSEGWYTHGDPAIAKIVGPVGAQVTFFDNDQYQMSENSMLVSLKVEGTDQHPVEFDLKYHRLGNGDHKDGVYSGEATTLGWVLYKHAKASWVQNTLRVIGKFADILAGILKEVPGASKWETYAHDGAVVIKKLDAAVDTPGSSDNSQVDNVSSVLFGAMDT